MQIHCDTAEYLSAINLCKNVKNRGFQAFLVGGCVRDLILGKTASDFDIATSMNVHQMKNAFTTSSINGEAHGTVLIHWDGYEFEMTQYRTESTYSDGRHPDSVKPADTFYEDTLRRDFTMNAMGIDCKGNVIDHHEGIKDLMAGVVRTVGSPVERFSEDYLRILRAIRFGARFGSISDDTKEAIRNLGGNLVNISRERIDAEVQKVCGYGNEAIERFVDFCIELNVFELVFPGANKTRVDLTLIKNCTLEILLLLLYHGVVEYKDFLQKSMKLSSLTVHKVEYYHSLINHCEIFGLMLFKSTHANEMNMISSVWKIIKSQYFGDGEQFLTHFSKINSYNLMKKLVNYPDGVSKLSQLEKDINKSLQVNTSLSGVEFGKASNKMFAAYVKYQMEYIYEI